MSAPVAYEYLRSSLYPRPHWYTRALIRGIDQKPGSASAGLRSRANENLTPEVIRDAL